MRIIAKTDERTVIICLGKRTFARKDPKESQRCINDWKIGDYDVSEPNNLHRKSKITDGNYL